MPTLTEFQLRIEQIASHYPYLVLENDGKMIGYAPMLQPLMKELRTLIDVN